jgi:hypothetical protein
MKALLVAAAAGLAMGAAAGIVLQLPAPVEAPLAYDFQSAAFTEDPGVELHRAVMGGLAWEAPQPYVPVTYPALSEPEPIPELVGLDLEDLRAPYVPPGRAADIAPTAALEPAATTDLPASPPAPLQAAAAVTPAPSAQPAALQVAAFTP